MGNQVMGWGRGCSFIEIPYLKKKKEQKQKEKI